MAKTPTHPAPEPVVEPVPVVAPVPEPVVVVNPDPNTPPDPPKGWTWDTSSARYKKTPTE